MSEFYRDDEGPVDIPEIIKSSRLKAELTQEQLADLSGLSVNVIAHYEKGRRSPRVDDLEKILLCCGLKLRLEAVSLRRVSTRERLEACREAERIGKSKAAKKLGHSPSAIQSWRKEFGLPPLKPGPKSKPRKFSDSQRKQIVKESMINGVRATSQKTGCSASTIYQWRKALGYSNPCPERGPQNYSEEFKTEAVEYAEEFGPKASAEKFGVALSSIRRWLLGSDSIRQKREIE